MKLLLVFATVLVAALAITDEQREKFEKIHKPCREANGVTDELIATIKDFANSGDVRLENTSLCAFKKLGFAYENGDLNTEALKKRVRAGVSSDEEAEKIIAKCTVKKETPGKTVKNTINCIANNVPNWSPVE
ncbi:hypothetical protein Zmor_010942 [Zophobas morio]|uniref:Uncharacterized protein n=1 Tax=Zophobas morio TaxID=2755281 RepID=A0AA38MK18_9CUCU|nr:hypothetical protein Zmor_010942 [Zophobas morio]